MCAILSREEFENREKQTLSPLASLAGNSLGRLFSEQEHPHRTAFQRDRDRLIHSTSFRRLEYKTQVFVNCEGDYYRTRLTHTMEVAQIARSLGRFLRLNEDLVEAMALAHDLGHTPFGHSVEWILADLLESHGGFEHNAQGLRCVDFLETPYPDFSGLNLTYEVRSIFTKKSSMAELRRKGFAAGESICFDQGPANLILEAQVVDLADSIAYNSHDVDDGLKSGLLSPEALQDVALWAEIWQGVRGDDESSRRRQAIREMINRQVTDCAMESLGRMNTLPLSADSPTSQSTSPSAVAVEYPPLSALPKVVTFSAAMQQANQQLKEFLHDNLYRHPQVTRKMDRARRMVRDLFLTYTERPEQMAPQYRARASQESVQRVACDYVAGMTDRFAEEEFISLFYPDSLSPRIR
jgi:dGTPase